MLVLLCLLDQVSDEGQRLLLPLDDVAHALDDHVDPGKPHEPAEMEQTSYKLTNQTGYKENHALPGVVHRKPVLIAEQIGQDKEDAEIGKACHDLARVVAAHGTPHSAVDITSRPGGGIRKISRLFLLRLLALGVLRLGPFAAVGLLAPALLVELLFQELTVYLPVLLVSARAC